MPGHLTPLDPRKSIDDPKRIGDFAGHAVILSCYASAVIHIPPGRVSCGTMRLDPTRRTRDMTLRSTPLAASILVTLAFAAPGLAEDLRAPGATVEKLAGDF